MENLKYAVDYGVIGLLAVLALWAVVVAVERWQFYMRVDPSQFGTLQAYEIALTQRLVVIGTIAANAPYIGLLGTVRASCSRFIRWGRPGHWPSARSWSASAWRSRPRRWDCSSRFPVS